MTRPRMLFVTRCRYWLPSNGEAARTAALIGVLAGACDLTVFFTGAADPATRAAVAASRHAYRLATGSSERPERAGGSNCRSPAMSRRVCRCPKAS